MFSHLVSFVNFSLREKNNKTLHLTNSHCFILALISAQSWDSCWSYLQMLLKNRIPQNHLPGKCTLHHLLSVLLLLSDKLSRIKIRNNWIDNTDIKILSSTLTRSSVVFNGLVSGSCFFDILQTYWEVTLSKSSWSTSSWEHTTRRASQKSTKSWGTAFSLLLHNI